MGHEATSDFAYSITSSAVARSKGEIVPLFSFNVPRDGGGYQTFGVRLTVASHRVYGWYRPRIPWIKAATLSTFFFDCGVKVSVFPRR